MTWQGKLGTLATLFGIPGLVVVLVTALWLDTSLFHVIETKFPACERFATSPLAV